MVQKCSESSVTRNSDFVNECVEISRGVIKFNIHPMKTVDTFFVKEENNYCFLFLNENGLNL